MASHIAVAAIRGAACFQTVSSLSARLPVPCPAVLKYIPLPNSGDGLFADASQKRTLTDDKMGQRVDFNNVLTGNWSFYYHFDDSTVSDPLAAASVPGFAAVTPTRSQLATLNNTRTFGPSQVNDFRLSFMRMSTVTTNPSESFAKLSDLGFVTGPNTLGINPSGPAGFPETVPPMYFNNFSIGVPTLTTFQPNNTWHVSDGFSKIAGQHSMKFGGEFRYLQINERNTCAPNGDFSFDGSETGNDIADFLIGAPVSYNQCSQQFLDSRTRYGGAYFQDTYKVKPNLTLNLGVRWEVSMPWYDTQGKIETIVPGLQSTQFPTAPLGWVVPGDPGIPSTLAPTTYNNWAPRLGMAYSPGFHDGVLGKVFGGPGKTSIRAAFGIYYTAVEDLNLFYEVGDAPFGLYWVSPEPTMFDEPFRTRSSGASQTQRFPFTFPIPGDPANKNSGLQHLPAHLLLARLLDSQQDAVRGALQLLHTAATRQRDSDDLGLCRNTGAQADLSIRRESRKSGPLHATERHGRHSGMRPERGANDLHAAGRQSGFRHSPGAWAVVRVWKLVHGQHRELELQLLPGHGRAEGLRCYVPRGLHVLEGDRQFFRIRRMGEFHQLPPKPLVIGVRRDPQLRRQL